MAGIASSSAPSVIGLIMIAFTLDPLGVPTSVAIILLITTDPIVDPILTALNVQTTCAMTVVLADENFEMKT